MSRVEGAHGLAEDAGQMVTGPVSGQQVGRQVGVVGGGFVDLQRRRRERAERGGPGRLPPCPGGRALVLGQDQPVPRGEGVQAPQPRRHRTAVVGVEPDLVLQYLAA